MALSLTQPSISSQDSKAAREGWAEVLAALRDADLFVLPSRIAKSGDRDGLPNVLMEAQSQGLACLATDVSAIPELIENGRSGVLVPPDDEAALADALQALIADPARRARLGVEGALRVRTAFAFDLGIDALAHRFALPRPAGPEADETTASCVLLSTPR